MEETTLSAAKNPGLANKLVQEAIADVPEAPAEAVIRTPLDVSVELPGGYITPDGEVLRTAEVRELNGRDEEAIVKASSLPKALATTLARGTVAIGNMPATEEVLDRILAADRDVIMLGIYKATFGNIAELGAVCPGCNDVKTVAVDLYTDIAVKTLVDPIEQREFTVKGRKDEYLVKLPEGRVQRELANNGDKTNSELDTILLDHCVTKINNRVVMGTVQIQNIGLQDRRAILSEILKRNPGPQFDDVKTICPDCGGEVVVPISLGALFRF